MGSKLVYRALGLRVSFFFGGGGGAYLRYFLRQDTKRVLCLHRGAIWHARVQYDNAPKGV